MPPLGGMGDTDRGLKTRPLRAIDSNVGNIRINPNDYGVGGKKNDDGIGNLYYDTARQAALLRSQMGGMGGGGEQAALIRMQMDERRRQSENDWAGMAAQAKANFERAQQRRQERELTRLIKALDDGNDLMFDDPSAPSSGQATTMPKGANAPSAPSSGQATTTPKDANAPSVPQALPYYQHMGNGYTGAYRNSDPISYSGIDWSNRGAVPMFGSWLYI
jgi:hypothetical protein